MIETLVDGLEGYDYEKLRFFQKLKLGRFTKAENPESHFVTFFLGFDNKASKVFIGHHKKSNLWIFMGGHLEPGESIQECFVREVWEEWGVHLPTSYFSKIDHISVTDIDNPTQKCKEHFDLWRFVELDHREFQPDRAKLALEFHEWGWKSIEEARAVVTDKNTLEVLRILALTFAA